MVKPTFNVNLQKDEEIIISKRKKRRTNMYFRPIGNASPSNPDCVDALEYICNFNKAELKLLKIVKESVDKWNKFSLPIMQLPSGEKQKLGSAIRSWIKKKLIYRTKPEHYMVNPHFLTPIKFEIHEEVLEEWVILTKENIV